MIIIFRIIPLIIGFIGELFIGWPNKLWHPIMGVGKLVSMAEKILRSCFPKTKMGERVAGIIMAIVLPIIVFALTFIPLFFIYKASIIAGLIVESIMCWTIFATGSLKKAAVSVYNALEHSGLEAGRKTVSMIVGRDTENLDEEGVIKATVETVAENLSDGVIAPMLFVFLGGGPLGYFYKTVNTMDSMVGYKNDRYIFFGTGGARLDDVCNFIPARLSALLMIMCSGICGFNMENGFKIFRRDRFNHASPNSAQTESVMAGALGVRLAGNASYFGKVHKKKTIGDPLRDIQSEDIKRACALMVASSIGAAALFLLVNVIIWSVGLLIW
jgi:adenosylcobinamide-phosphate synthase